MKKKEARRIVNENLEKLRWALQLQDWQIDIVWGEIEGGDGYGLKTGNTIGRCESVPLYRRATIEINHKLHDTEEKLLKTLLHEMLHVFGSGFEMLRAQTGKIVSDAQFDVLESAVVQGHESLVLFIERMLTMGLGLTPDKMIELSKAHSQRPKEPDDADLS